MKFSELALAEYARRVASSDATPGGGSVAAAVGALGAGLVRMVALLTSESPKFAEVAARARRIAEAAEKLVNDFLSGVDEDIVAFDRVTEAFRLPKSSEQEKAARAAAIQDALRGAAEPPLRTAELARETCALAVELVEFGNPNALSDVGCAALLASAAARGAAINVAINAKSLKDRAEARRLTNASHDVVAQVGLLAEVVIGKVEAAVGPSRICPRACLTAARCRRRSATRCIGEPAPCGIAAWRRRPLFSWRMGMHPAWSTRKASRAAAATQQSTFAWPSLTSPALTRPSKRSGARQPRPRSTAC